MRWLANFLGSLVGTIIVGVLVMSYGSTGPTPYVALAVDGNCGNGGPCVIQVGVAQSGTDPGGGICASGTIISLCNPITGTITDSNATPFSSTNASGTTTFPFSTTGVVNFTSAATGTNNAFAFQALASGTGASIITSGHVGVNTNCTGATPVTCATGIGTITLSAGSGTVTFTPNFKAAPICLVKDITTPANALTITSAVGSLAISGGTTTDVVAYICLATNGG